MTDGDDGLADSSLEILKVSYHYDGTYYYFRLELEGAPSGLGSNTWGIYLDTDGDDNNDYAIKENDTDEIVYFQWDGGGGDWDRSDSSGVGSGDENVRTGSNYISFRVDPAKSGSFDNSSKITAFADSDGDYSLESSTTQNPRNGQLGDHEDATGITTIPEFHHLLLPIMALMAFAFLLDIKTGGGSGNGRIMKYKKLARRLERQEPMNRG
jgi:hypothetical protein